MVEGMVAHYRSTTSPPLLRQNLSTVLAGTTALAEAGSDAYFVVVPAPVPPGMVEVSVQRSGEHVHAVCSPGTCGYHPSEWNTSRFRVNSCGHSQALKRAPHATVPPLVEQITIWASGEDINPFWAPTARSRGACQRGGDGDGGIDFVYHLRPTQGGKLTPV